MREEYTGRGPWGRPLLIIVAVGILLRLGSIALSLHFDRSPVRGDAITYESLARSLAAGHGYLHQGRTDNVRPPLYPFVLSLVYRATGPSPVAGTLLQTAFDAATLVVLAGFTWSLTGSVAGALLAAGIFALWPGAMLMNVVLYTEPLFTLLLLLAVAALIRLESDGRARWVVATGLLFGLLGLTRQTTLYFLPGYLVIAPILLRGRTGPRLWARLGALLLCVAVIAPWTIRDRVLNGEVTWLRGYNGLNLWLGNHLPYEGRAIDRASLDRIIRDMGPRASLPGEIDRELGREAIRQMRAHPAETAWLWVQKAYRFLFVDMRPHHLDVRVALSLMLLALYALAAVGIRACPPGAVPSLLVMGTMFGYFVLAHVVSYSQMRFAEPVRPLVFALAGPGLLHLWRRWRAGRDRSPAAEAASRSDSG